jgi:hypothetical protein
LKKLKNDAINGPEDFGIADRKLHSKVRTLGSVGILFSMAHSAMVQRDPRRWISSMCMNVTLDIRAKYYDNKSLRMELRIQDFFVDKKHGGFCLIGSEHLFED